MLERHDVTIATERNSRKEPLTDAEARELIRTAGTVKVARGKKVEDHPAKDATPAMLRGPSGNYRAPLLVRGKTILVGLSLETLEAWFG